MLIIVFGHDCGLFTLLKWSKSFSLGQCLRFGTWQSLVITWNDKMLQLQWHPGIFIIFCQYGSCNWIKSLTFPSLHIVHCSIPDVEKTE